MSYGLRSASFLSWHLLEEETVAAHKKDCAKADRAVNGSLAKKIFFLTTKVVPVGSS